MVPTEYDERLSVPLRWWVQGTMLVASLWLALAVATPEDQPWLLWSVTAVALAVMTALLVGWGAARLRVADGWFHAGRARIAVHHLGEATPLDREQTRRVAGRDADARAYLLLRPYLSRSVRVEIADPADPTPYWLVSTRRPDALAAALTTRSGQPSGPPAG